MHLVSPCAWFQMVKAFGQHPGCGEVTMRTQFIDMLCVCCWKWQKILSLSLKVWILSPFFPFLWSHENGTVFYDFMSLVIGKTWKEQDQQGRREWTERTERRGSRFQFGMHQFRPIFDRRTSIKITGICRNGVTGFKQLWLQFWFHTGRARVVT